MVPEGTDARGRSGLTAGVGGASELWPFSPTFGLAPATAEALPGVPSVFMTSDTSIERGLACAMRTKSASPAERGKEDLVGVGSGTGCAAV